MSGAASGGRRGPRARAPSPPAVSRSILSVAGLARTVLRRYALEAPVTCVLWVEGVHDTYRVQAAGATHWLRVYPAGARAPAAIAAELELLDDLAAARVPVAAPIHGKDGRSFYGVAAPEGRRYAALFAHAPGSAAIVTSPARAQRYGQTAAIIHQIADRKPAGYRRPQLDPRYLIDRSLASIARYFSHRPRDLDYLCRLAAALAEKIRQLLPGTATPEYGLCHADLHPYNVRWEQDEMTLFDFDLCGYGWRAYDIAVFL